MVILPGFVFKIPGKSKKILLSGGTGGRFGVQEQCMPGAEPLFIKNGLSFFFWVCYNSMNCQKISAVRPARMR